MCKTTVCILHFFFSKNHAYLGIQTSIHLNILFKKYMKRLILSFSKEQLHYFTYDKYLFSRKLETIFKRATPETDRKKTHHSNVLLPKDVRRFISLIKSSQVQKSASLNIYYVLCSEKQSIHFGYVVVLVRSRSICSMQM